MPGPARLSQNTPNPFNPLTTFRYNVPRAGRVVLSVYDQRGARVATVLEATVPAGEGQVDWDGRDGRGCDLPSGVYLARLETEDGPHVVKVMLAR